MKLKARNVVLPLLLTAGIAPAISEANGNFHVLGDSFSDSGRFLRDLGIEYYSPTDGYQDGRFTNGLSWTEYVSEGTGLNHIQTENYAYGGAFSGSTGLLETFNPALFPAGFSAGYLTQVNEFTNKVGSLDKDDVTAIWIGMNDIHFAAGTGGTAEIVTTQVINNTLQGVNAITSIGGKNLLMVGMYDAAEIDGVGSGIYASYDEAVATSASELVNEQLKTFQIEGVNIHYLDTFTLLQRIQNNPSQYGYISTSASNSCLANGCGGLSVEEQNKYLFMDVLHLTAGFNELLADYAVNILSAGSVAALQAEAGVHINDKFQQDLLLQFSDQSGDFASVDEWSWMLTPHYSQSKQRSSGIGNSEAEIDQTGLTLGGQYAFSKQYRLGFAANYTHSESDLSGGFGNSDTDAVQVAGFLNYRKDALFADMGLSVMRADNDLIREGVIDNLKASPDSDAWGAFAQLGYLYDIANDSIQIGPVASLRHTNLELEGYTEAGDSILTIDVAEQDVKQTSASLGVLMKSAFGTQDKFNYQLQLAMEYQEGDERHVDYSQTNAATRALSESVENDNDTYASFSAVVGYPLEKGIDLFMTVDATAERDRGNRHGLQVGVKFTH